MGGDETLYWGMLLVGAFFLLIFAEVVVPSGGLISLVAALAGLTGVGMMWVGGGATWGLSGLLVLMVLGPMAFLSAMKLLPGTKLGRNLMGIAEDTSRAEELAQREAEKKALIGQEGVAVHDLRPIGDVRLESGQKIEVLSEMGIIEHGTRVKVVAVVDNQIKVRKA